MTPDTERCEWCGQPWTSASRLQGWCEKCGCDIDGDAAIDDYDIEPIRGRIWEPEDIEDLGGIDTGWPGEDE